MRHTDWGKWGAVAGIAAVLASLLAILVSHRDQRERVYISVVPVGYKVAPSGPEEFMTVMYSINVTGKSPARNVYLRERCVSPRPMQPIKPQAGKELLAQFLPPGSVDRTCGIEIKEQYPDESMMFVGLLSYEDDQGQHSVSFCFEGLTPRMVLDGRKYAEITPCDFKFDYSH